MPPRSTLSLVNARRHRDAGEHNRAVANYLAILPLMSSPANIEEEFLDVLQLFCDQLLSTDAKSAFEYFLLAQGFFPQSPRLLEMTGSTFAQIEELDKAIPYFEEALKLDPHRMISRASLDSIRARFFPAWHFRMLNDSRRNAAYYDALQQAIQQNPGASVLDIGSGTGLLAAFASALGAASVTAVECEPGFARIAARLLTANGAKAEVHACWSYDLEAKCYDVIVSEIMDAGAFGEGLLPAMKHALETFSTSTTIVIPQRVQVFVAPIACEYVRKSNFHEQFVSEFVTRKDPYDAVDLRRVKGGFVQLDTPQTVLAVDLTSSVEIEEILRGFSTNMTFTCNPVEADAIMLYFEATLAPGISVSSSPVVESCWDQAVFPLDRTLTRSAAELGIQVKFTDRFEVDCVTGSNQLKPELPQDLIRLLNDPMPAKILATAGFAMFPDAKTVWCVADFPVDLPGKSVSCFVHETKLLNVFPKNERFSVHNASQLSSVKSHSEKVHLLLWFPISQSGELKTSIFDMVSVCALEQSCQVFPQTITLKGCLVLSPELESLCTVNDRNCCGIKVSEFVKEFVPSYIPGVDGRTLQYTVVSDVHDVFCVTLPSSGVRESCVLEFSINSSISDEFSIDSSNKETNITNRLTNSTEMEPKMLLFLLTYWCFDGFSALDSENDFTGCAYVLGKFEYRETVKVNSRLEGTLMEFRLL